VQVTNIYATFRTVSVDTALRAVPQRQLSFLLIDELTSARTVSLLNFPLTFTMLMRLSVIEMERWDWLVLPFCQLTTTAVLVFRVHNSTAST